MKHLVSKSSNSEPSSITISKDDQGYLTKYVKEDAVYAFENLLNIIASRNGREPAVILTKWP